MKECCGRIFPSGKSHDDGIVVGELNHAFFFGVLLASTERYRSMGIGDWAGMCLTGVRRPCYRLSHDNAVASEPITPGPSPRPGYQRADGGPGSRTESHLRRFFLRHLGGTSPRKEKDGRAG